MPLYVFRFRGEEGGDKVEIRDSEGASAVAKEEPRDLVRVFTLQGSLPASIGEGRGVIFNIAANWGEERPAPGDKEPALECKAARMLGVRLGILEVEMEWRR